MSFTTTSPNMNLTIPTVSQEPGPDYASDINSSLSVIDAHDHSTGKGVQITPAGLNINSDLSLGANNATQARSLRFNAQPSPISGISDLGCIYESGVDLYYNDGSGNQIRITQSGGVAGSPGSITGLVAPATVTYVAPTFVFQSGVNIAGNLDGRNLVLRNSTASSNGLTLSPPNAIASDYTITMPTLPGSQSIMTLDASGAIATPAVYPITAAGIATGTINTSSFNSSVYSTQTQQEAGTDNTVLVTPAKQQYHPSASKGWVKADFGGTALGSYNVSSITDTSGGVITVNWATSFSSTNYAVVATAQAAGAGAATTFIAIITEGQVAVGSVQVRAIRMSDGAVTDCNNLHVIAFGDQ